jgi:hypothetical protein
MDRELHCRGSVACAWLYHLKWYQVWIFLFLGFLYTPYITKLRLKRQVVCLGHILICLGIWMVFPYQSFKYWVIPGLVSGFFFGFVFIYAAHSDYWQDKKYFFGPLAIGHDHHHENQAPSLWNWIIDGKVLGLNSGIDGTFPQNVMQYEGAGRS